MKKDTMNKKLACNINQTYLEAAESLLKNFGSANVLTVFNQLVAEAELAQEYRDNVKSSSSLLSKMFPGQCSLVPRELNLWNGFRVEFRDGNNHIEADPWETYRELTGTSQRDKELERLRVENPVEFCIQRKKTHPTFLYRVVTGTPTNFTVIFEI
jgi:hypothetical protein